MIELDTIYQEHLAEISRINKNYERYKGKQAWELPGDLDFKPTQNITNYTKKLIDKKARFMFGKEPFFDLRGEKLETKNGDTIEDERVEQKEKLLEEIMRSNKFHSKLLKAKKDCSIGGRVAIKLWATKEKLKIVFSPAQEFFPVYSIDDVDELERVYFVYTTKDAEERKDQRVVRQKFEMLDGKCYVEEGIYNGYGELVQITEEHHANGLDFIPVTIISNGGLTGEIKGESDVETLWSNQDAYNKLKSDDIDALKFNMFPLIVASDVSSQTVERIVIAPNALVDLKTDRVQAEKRQGKLEKLEGGFTYGEKFEKTIDRIKSDMHELLDVPNTGVDQLRGTITSGKSMQVLYWDLQAVCEEEWTEWEPALKQVVDHIFKLTEVYNIGGQAELARVPSETYIQHYYMNPDDEEAEKKMDLQEVLQKVRSRASYIKKWAEAEDSETELQAIAEEQTKLEHGAWEYGLYEDSKGDATTDA